MMQKPLDGVGVIVFSREAANVTDEIVEHHEMHAAPAAEGGEEVKRARIRTKAGTKRRVNGILSDKDLENLACTHRDLPALRAELLLVTAAVSKSPNMCRIPWWWSDIVVCCC